jgi:hypothetical protein
MRWHDLLDEIERRNSDYDRFLRHVGPAPRERPLPADPGPLPIELRSRAEEALAETRRLELAALASRSTTLMLLARRPENEHEPACYVDTVT